MDFDPAALIASLVVSGIGTVAFVYGKRQSRLPHMLTGVVLGIFPYFVSNVFLIAGITIGLLGLLWAATRFANL